MGVKTVSTNNFAPSGSAAYNQVTPQAANVMSQYMQNPLQSSFFQQMLGMSNASTGQQGQSQMANLLRNNINGGGAANPYLQSLQAQQGRATSSQMAQNFGSLLQNSVGNQLQATNMASNFRPLQTGQTQSQSGLGTWLPQLLGGAIGGVAGLFTGGASKAAGAMTGTMGAMNAAMSPMQSPFLGAGSSYQQGGMGSGAPNIAAPMPGSNYTPMFQ